MESIFLGTPKFSPNPDKQEVVYLRQIGLRHVIRMTIQTPSGSWPPSSAASALFLPVLHLWPFATGELQLHRDYLRQKARRHNPFQALSISNSEVHFYLSCNVYIRDLDKPLDNIMI